MKKFKSWWLRNTWHPTNIVYTRANTPEFGGEIKLVHQNIVRRIRRKAWGFLIDYKCQTRGLSHFFQDIGITFEDCKKAFRVDEIPDDNGIDPKLYPEYAKDVKKIKKKKKSKGGKSDG